MYSYWEIKTIASVAMVGAPLLALFNCPCAVSVAENQLDLAVESLQDCCCCQAATKEDSCCDTQRKVKDNNENTHEKHKCGDAPCTCVVGEMRAVSPTPQRYDLMPQAYTCEVAPWDSQTSFWANVLAIDLFRIPHAIQTPTHLMNCILLC